MSQWTGKHSRKSAVPAPSPRTQNVRQSPVSPGVTMPQDVRDALIALYASMGKDIDSKSGSVASSGNNELIAADATKKIKVVALALTTVSTTALTCIFQAGASGTELWRYIFQALAATSTGGNLAVPPPGLLMKTAINQSLNLNLSSAQAVHYSVAFYKEV